MGSQNIYKLCTFSYVVKKAFSDYWKKQNPQALVDDDQSNGSSSNNGSLGGSGSFYNVMVPLALYTVVFFIQALLVTIPDITPTHFLIVTFIGLALCGTCGAIATAGIVSAAGLFPSHIGIGPFFSGQALGGAGVSIANFAAIAIGEDPNDYIKNHCTPAANHSQEVNYETNNSIVSIAPKRRMDDIHTLLEEGQECSTYHDLDWAVLTYFLLGCIILLLCLVGYNQIFKYQNMSYQDDYETVHDHHYDRSDINNSSAPYVDEIDDLSPRIGLELNECIHQQQQTQYSDDENLIESPPRSEQLTMIPSHRDQLVPDNYATSRNNKVRHMPLSETIQLEAPSSNSLCLPNKCGGTNNDEVGEENQIEADSFEDEREETVDDLDSTKSVFWAIKSPAACIFLTFTITLSLFPSWISELKSSHECESRFRLDNDLYVPFSFVFFNIGDLLGRLISGYIPVDRIKNLSRKLVFGAMLRVGFLPLFLMCNTTTGKDSEMVVRNDFFSLLVQLFFALSNGLLVSTAFILSPRLVGSTSTIQERASEIMTFSVYFGLLSGSFLAFPFVQLATRIFE